MKRSWLMVAAVAASLSFAAPASGSNGGGPQLFPYQAEDGSRWLLGCVEDEMAARLLRQKAAHLIQMGSKLIPLVGHAGSWQGR